MIDKMSSYIYCATWRVISWNILKTILTVVMSLLHMWHFQVEKGYA